MAAVAGAGECAAEPSWCSHNLAIRPLSKRRSHLRFATVADVGILGYSETSCYPAMGLSVEGSGSLTNGLEEGARRQWDLSSGAWACQKEGCDCGKENQTPSGWCLCCASHARRRLVRPSSEKAWTLPMHYDRFKGTPQPRAAPLSVFR